VYYYVYETVCLENGKIYVGAHKTKNLNDNYIGSGKILSHAIKKYGRDKFIRKILKFFDTEKEMFEYETVLVNEEFLNRDDVYNLSLGGLGGDRSAFFTEETIEKCRKKSAGENNPYYGIKHSIEIRKKISETLLEKGSDWLISNASNAGKGNIGKKRNEDQKLKYHEIANNREKYTCEHCGKEGQRNSMIGYHGEKCSKNPNAIKRIWINDGHKNKLVLETEIPKGSNMGRKK
jgi:hypothetical protein